MVRATFALSSIPYLKGILKIKIFKMEFIQVNASTGEHEHYTYERIAGFLATHLEQYGDSIEDILKCIAYVKDHRRGGNIIIGIDGDKIAGITILNNTGMRSYIPENILVYIAVDSSHRGKGYGKQLMEQAISVTDGSIALHVEPDNPAVHLYSKLGFTNKYLEMRLNR